MIDAHRKCAICKKPLIHVGEGHYPLVGRVDVCNEKDPRTDFFYQRMAHWECFSIGVELGKQDLGAFEIPNVAPEIDPLPDEFKEDADTSGLAGKIFRKGRCR
mgnify:CR=1 FL=1